MRVLFLSLMLGLATSSQARLDDAGVTEFLGNYCIECHGPEEQKSNVRLDTLSLRIADESTAQLWKKVEDQLLFEEMPPPKSPQPPAAAREGMVDWIQRSHQEALEELAANSGRVELRRLNNREYIRTMADLLHLDPTAVRRVVEQQVRFPADDSSTTFDTAASAQTLTHIHLEKYSAAAEQLLELALADPEVKPLRWELNPTKFQVEKAKDLLAKLDAGTLRRADTPEKQAKERKRWIEHLRQYQDRVAREDWEPILLPPRLDDFPRFLSRSRIADLVGAEWVDAIYVDRHGKPLRGRRNDFDTGSLFSWQKGLTIRHAGRYRIMARLAVEHLAIEGVPKNERLPQIVAIKMKRNNEDRFLAGAWQVDTPLERIGEDEYSSERYLSPGRYHFWITEELTYLHEVMRHGALDANLFIESLHVEGPLPQAGGHSRQTILFDGPIGQRREYAESVILRFADRAYRRPLSSEDREFLLNHLEGQLTSGLALEPAVRSTLAYVLSSPQTLYLIEEPAVASAHGPYAVDDHALASRLSYFLWGSPPDETLRRLADAGRLHDSGNLRQQIERMMADPRSDHFFAQLAAQWFHLDRVEERLPDVTLFPWFDEHLRRSMIRETELFLRECYEANLPLENFVDSDFAMLNERLAVHYGIHNVKGDHFRKVTLPPDLQRGGLLGQASVLTATSTDVRTSPVGRGVYVLEALLGDPPPPPPMNVPDLAEIPDMRDGEPVTVTQKMVLHRDSDACRSCHQKIDPLGLALEGFDAIGRWRESYGAPAKGGEWQAAGSLEVAGAIPRTGSSFANPQEYRRALLASHGDQLTVNTLEHLLSFALGRGMASTDQVEIDRLAKRTREEENGFRSALFAAIESPLFRQK